MAVTLEQVLDKIATTLITNGVVDPTTIRDNQKTIRNGIIQVARDNSEKLLLFEKDKKANEEDLASMSLTGTELTSLSAIVNACSESGATINNIEINSTSQTGSESDYTTVYLYCFLAGVDINITPLIQSAGNPFNVSQFMNLIQSGSVVNPDQAHEFLDTNIFELLPGGKTRQQRINDFFAEWNFLRGGEPSFEDTDGDGFIADDFDSVGYSDSHDISATQDPDSEAEILEEESFITRLDDDAYGDNSGKTIESLRNQLNEYLKDIDEDPTLAFEDIRPTYKNVSDGYLKFRQLNQGIIIRSTQDEFIEGLNPSTQEYLTTGFTITMWVRFLDKVSSGTLFNFGNPTRTNSPMGFKLETLIESEERFLKLTVRESNTTRTSTFPTTVTTEPINTQVPVDLSEWYFIVATFNTGVNEDGSEAAQTNPDYWRNNIDSSGNYVAQSYLGNKCKVEIISRSDLLRARGYKV